MPPTKIDPAVADSPTALVDLHQHTTLVEGMPGIVLIKFISVSMVVIVQNAPTVEGVNQRQQK